MKTLEIIKWKNTDKSLYVDGKGLTIRKGSNAEYAQLRVQMGGDGGYQVIKGAIVKAMPRTAAITLPLELIEDVKAGANLNELLVELGLPALTIVYEESLEPFYEGQEFAQNKDGSLRETADGENYYFRAICVEDDSAAKDVRLPKAASTTKAPAKVMTAAEKKAEAARVAAEMAGNKRK